jgi:uncharacterized protein YceH (UPF0502 family)
VELLNSVEVRVLGALIEKEITTPEYYPMTLNALVNACNQKSNREPVVSYDDDSVEEAVESLRHKKLTYVITGAGMRVPKYSHRLGESLNLGRREVALLCVLMLRGHQTLGELRDRTERMHSFADLEEVESCLDHLAQMEPPLVKKLPRQPGTKEPRYCHLLSGDVQPAEPGREMEPERRVPMSADRMASLEAQVASLWEEVEDLKRQFAEFRRQFE